ncbi:SDR family oxidoreductase [Rhodococcus sp. NPDC057529]|uniref:SDR family oxidoreductase n=1 Tax=Rhodococcus sp. NPDC057529 TaxID=3346158 RepID=UPI003670EFAF
MSLPHEGHVAVVTGSAAGIGREYARGLAGQGAKVVVADIDVDGAKATADLITSAGGIALPAEVDVSSSESTKSLAETVRSEFGAAHIVVNNAAIFHNLRKDPQLTVDIDYWRKVFSVNLDGALLVTQAFAPLLQEAGWGRVVIQTSSAAYISSGVYGVTKLALLSLMRGFAKELGEYGVTVNGIAPGAITTEAMLDTVSEDRRTQLLQAQFIKRHGTPEDLVGPLLFLCSDAAAWMTGQTLVVDGGATNRL